jgi:hypothetical protein
MKRVVSSLLVLFLLPLKLFAAQGSVKFINTTKTMKFKVQYIETHSNKKRGWYTISQDDKAAKITTERTLSAPDIKDMWVKVYNKKNQYLGLYKYTKNINVKNNKTTKVELNWSLDKKKPIRRVFKSGKNELDFKDFGEQIWGDDLLLNLLVASRLLDDPSAKVSKFMYETLKRIKDCLKGKNTKSERKKVLNYQHSKKEFEPDNCKFFGDCSWWASMVLERSFPNLYNQMLNLKEPHQPVLRAYVYYHIFNELLRLKGEKPLSEPNSWVKTIVPEQLQLIFENNKLTPNKIKKALRSYKQRYNFFEQMGVNDWKQTLSSIKDNWKIIKKVEDFKPGDFFVSYYNYDKKEVEKGETGSTGHIMMVAGYPKKVNPFIWHVPVADSATPKFGDNSFTDIIRKRLSKDPYAGDTGIGLRYIGVLTNLKGEAIAWQSKESFTKWKDYKGRFLTGRVVKDLAREIERPKLITPPEGFEEGDPMEIEKEEVEVNVQELTSS